MSLLPNLITKPLNKQHKTLRQSGHKQEGVVLVIALFIVALVAAMAYTMMARVERDTRRALLISRYTQAEYDAEGSIDWARDQLQTNWERRKANQLIDVMPFSSKPFTTHGYRVQSTIYDMQSRFNINNLSDTEYQQSFKRLLRAIDPKLSEEAAQSLIRAMVDWITPITQANEFSQYYLELPIPYRPAHRFMTQPSELRLVKGMTPALYDVLRPYVIALPLKTAINVQTALPPVLMALSPNMNRDIAQTLTRMRTQSPFITTQYFLSLDIVKNLGISSDQMTTTSTYFLVETKVTIEKQQIVLYTLLERSMKGEKARTTIVWQSKGTY